MKKNKKKEKCILVFIWTDLFCLFDAMFKLKRANYIHCIQILYFLYVLQVHLNKLECRGKVHLFQ